MIRNLIQGRPFGYPLHPMIVHFPIALFILTLLLDGAALLLNGGNSVVRAAYYTLIGGTVMALLAVIAGLVDYADIRRDHPAKRTATIHMILNLTATAIAIAGVVLRSNQLEAEMPPLPAWILSLASAGIVLVSGYLGGNMVYEDGIGVGRHRRTGKLPHTTLQVTSENGMARIGSVDALLDGETLRAEVDGVVMSIVRLSGEYFAFQEFCTHRFGPLSEGEISYHEVTCPWHRSCFDVRTGEVTQGPAKLALKTFAVEVRDGAVMVQAPTDG